MFGLLGKRVRHRGKSRPCSVKHNNFGAVVGPERRGANSIGDSKGVLDEIVRKMLLRSQSILAGHGARPAVVIWDIKEKVPYRFSGQL